MTRTDVPLIIDCECAYVEIGLNARNPNVFAAVDFDEKLQDAITDEWKIISDTGTSNPILPSLDLLTSFRYSVLLKITESPAIFIPELPFGISVRAYLNAAIVIIDNTGIMKKNF